jgi:hypothetical protein
MHGPAGIFGWSGEFLFAGVQDGRLLLQFFY